MKTHQFILFISVFLSIYGLLNFYIWLRGFQAIPAASAFRTPYIIVFIVLASSFFIGRILESKGFPMAGTPLIILGSFWFGAMTYFFLLAGLLDLLRLVNHLVPIFPLTITQNYTQAKIWALLGAMALVSVTLLAGFINAKHLRIRTFDFTLTKPAPRKTLNIVSASDIHIGHIVGRSQLKKLVNSINALKPDILLPGDILDEELGPVIRNNLGELLKELHAPLGVYACTGNHEYIGGIEAADPYLREHGIRLLRDQWAFVDNAFYVVGREDRSGKSFTGNTRKSVEEVMQGVDTTRPVFMMDHQPFKLEEDAKSGADLVIFGHTHHGQFWPINLITNLVYEKSYGYLKKGNAHLYISSGAGTWGPPIRLWANPEIVNYKIRFGN